MPPNTAAVLPLAHLQAQHRCREGFTNYARCMYVACLEGASICVLGVYKVHAGQRHVSGRVI